MADEAPDQLALIGPRGGLLPRSAPRRAGSRTAGREAALIDPVAHVLLDSPLPRLDRPFDYQVPQDLDRAVRLGVRVRVRFGGRRIEGWVLGRSAHGEHQGPLQPIESIANPDPVLTGQSLGLYRAVAEHYGGTLSDVLRLAIPPRSGSVPTPAPALPLLAHPVERRLAPGAGRWIWTCPPAVDWVSWFAGTLATTAFGGGRSLAVVPETRDANRLAAALSLLVPDQVFAVLTGQEPPLQRYQAFQAVLAGAVPIVVGTRSAALAPLPDPDVMLLWDDGNDSHLERRAPYPHAREVLALRSQQRVGTFVVGSYGRSPNAQRWIEIGWAADLGPSRAELRVTAPTVLATDDDAGHSPTTRVGRLPAAAGADMRTALQVGPVLVCVGRKGYIPRLRCAECGRAADCATCGGPLLLSAADAEPSCGACGRVARDWACIECHGQTLRWAAVGIARTAEELGRAFPGVPVVVSAGSRVVAEVAGKPAIVLATPGAEPRAGGGYAAAVLLDVAEALAGSHVRGRELAARRWFGVGGLLRPGAPLVVVADPALAAVQALIRWDPGWLAARELEERRTARMPPAYKVIAVTGDSGVLEEVRRIVPGEVVVHGPTRANDREELHLVLAHRQAGEVLALLRSLVVRRSAEGASPVLIRVDPDL